MRVTIASRGARVLSGAHWWMGIPAELEIEREEEWWKV
jgi:hypothetical protein